MKGKLNMDVLDYQEVKKHVNILNVAYHLCLEITDDKHTEIKAICPFCGYNKNSKIATLSLNKPFFRILTFQFYRIIHLL